MDVGDKKGTYRHRPLIVLSHSLLNEIKCMNHGAIKKSEQSRTVYFSQKSARKVSDRSRLGQISFFLMLNIRVWLFRETTKQQCISLLKCIANEICAD